MQRSTSTTAAPDYRRNIFEAALHNDHEAVRLFVEGVPVDSVNADNQTAAHIAAKNGNLAILKYLLGKKPTLVHTKDAQDQTVLHLAVEKGSRELVQFLVDDCKANMYEPCEQRFNNTPIHMAAHEGNLEVLKFFVEDKKADMNVKNGYGEPPAFSAAEKSRVDIIEYLLKQKADLTMVDVNNMNILFISATTGDVSVPRFLLDRAKLNFDINWKDNFGDAILHRAAWNNRLEFVMYIVKSHRPDLSIIDTYDRTPLHVAAHQGFIALVRFLVGHGSDTELEDCWHRRPIETSSNYEVINYLDSVQGYQFTLHETYREPTPRTMPEIPTLNPLRYGITSEFRKPRTRPRLVRERRSTSIYNIPYVRQTSSPTGLLCKWIQQRNITEVREHGIEKTVQSAEFPTARVNGFLVLANACARYFIKSRNQRVEEPFSSPPFKIKRHRMSAIVEGAVNDALFQNN
jgi:ankyrin repeat protein